MMVAKKSPRKPGAEKLAFHVSDLWPTGAKDATPDVRRKAVRDLVANHTIIVGQSRSGKTSSARRLVEEIIAWTEARIVILDPNADFRWLNEIGPAQEGEEDAPFAERWKTVSRDIRIAAQDTDSWGIQWGKLSQDEMAAFLRLTPSDSFAEYRHLDRHIKYQRQLANKRGQDAAGFSISDFISDGYFEVAVGEELERYRLRLVELSNRRVWWTGRYKRDLDSAIESQSRAVVVDLSTDDEQVRMITAGRALEKLWRDGLERRARFISRPKDTVWPGTIVVIDEAHLFAPPETQDPQQRLVSERIQRFADQGKKLNLYLLVLTQQPAKLHPTVLAEFNNRIVLRMNEKRSLKKLEEMYGGMPGRYDGALTFAPGEALIEGDLLSDEVPPPAVPRGVRFKEGRTRAGGSTPPANWAFPRQ